MAQHNNSKFNVIAFYTAREDLAHISFVHEATNGFLQWPSNIILLMILQKTGIILMLHFFHITRWYSFLDTRPDSSAQRDAFKQYMDNGGGWMGFHFAGFALTPSAYPQNWDWYHNQFLGAGEYKSNTWRPTSAILRVEDRKHPATKHLPETFKSAPSEWYRWNNDLRMNSNIKILLSIDSSSFPLGTGPKLYEIWHSGYYPVVWTNTNYRMIYLNMGHNDMDYENKTNKELSSTFSSKIQNQLIIDALLWLGNGKKIRAVKK